MPPEQPTDQAVAPAALDAEAMVAALKECTGVDIASLETAYMSYIGRARMAVQESELHNRLVDIHSTLSSQRVAGNISALESWSSGDSEFQIVPKSWASLVDKLYRVNIEQNKWWSRPPIAPTLLQRVNGVDGDRQLWITPENAHEVIDDLVRTKFVVPFVDGVIDVGGQIESAINDCGVRLFRRYHAKDTGYHAHHYYAVIPVPGDSDAGIPETDIALEVKVLTKMQDQLGELTHILYQQHRTGAVRLEKKRKLAWNLGSPDFLAAYLGHTGHYLESAISDLKSTIHNAGQC